jgi:hypothetical protein
MAKATTPTLLSLDQFAEVLGIDPFHFNQIVCASFPEDDACNSVWFQNSWQRPGKSSREELARAIGLAEQMISNRVGFFTAPDWTVAEEHHLAPVRLSPEYYAFPRNRLRTLKLNNRYFISGGRLEITKLSTIPVPDYDWDNDNFSEKVVLTASDSSWSGIKAEEVFFFPRDFYPFPLDEWEQPEQYMSPHQAIRNLHIVVEGGNSIKAYGPRAYFVQPKLWERDYIDGDDPDNYISEVDVYRFRTVRDTDAYAPLEFYNQDPRAVDLVLQGYGVMQPHKSAQGVVSIVPAAWNTTTLIWDTSLPPCGGIPFPDMIHCFYRSGWALDAYGRMRAPFDSIVTMLATSLLTSPLCVCTPLDSLVEYWQSEPEQPSSAELACPWGLKRGAYLAWQQVNIYMLELDTLST